MVFFACVADMDRFGIDYQLMSVTPILFQWTREPRITLEVIQCTNDLALEMCASPEAQNRVFGLAQVPLQDVDVASMEVERAFKCGHKGVQLGNHVMEKNLDDAGLLTFMKHCASLGIPILVHPWDLPTLEGRMLKYMMQWTVGMPMETHVSIASMLLGGAFDELPADGSLKLCFAHGGRSFPFLLGRIDNAWHEREVARGKSEHPLSHYVKQGRFTVDSAFFDPRALRLVIDTMGEDNIMLGSDYPFPLGEQSIGELLRTYPDISESGRAKMLGGNAMDFFGLPPLQATLADELATALHVPLCAPGAEGILPTRENTVRNFVGGQESSVDAHEDCGAAGNVFPCFCFPAQWPPSGIQSCVIPLPGSLLLVSSLLACRFSPSVRHSVRATHFSSHISSSIWSCAVSIKPAPFLPCVFLLFPFCSELVKAQHINFVRVRRLFASSCNQFPSPCLDSYSLSFPVWTFLCFREAITSDSLRDGLRLSRDATQQRKTSRGTPSVQGFFSEISIF